MKTGGFPELEQIIKNLPELLKSAVLGVIEFIGQMNYKVDVICYCAHMI